MNIFKRLAQFGLVSSFLLTPSLQAEYLDSTKSSSSKGIFSNTFSDVMIRNTQARKAGKNFKGTWEARYTLGSTFFNDFMTAQVVFGAIQTGGTATITDRGTHIETSFDVYSNDYVYFQPLVEVWFPGTAKSNIRTVIGSNQGVKYKAGDFSIGLHHYALAYLGSEHSQVPLLNNGEPMKDLSAIPSKTAEKFHLAQDKKEKTISVDQRAATLQQIAILATKWSPSFIGGFSMSLNGYMEQAFKPQMEFVSETEKISVVRTGFLNMARYDVSNDFYGRLRLAYDLTKDTKFQFDTYLYDSGNVELLSTVSTKLF